MTAENVAAFAINLPPGFITKVAKNDHNPELHLYHILYQRGFNLEFNDVIKQGDVAYQEIKCPNLSEQFRIDLRTSITQKLPDYRFLYYCYQTYIPELEAIMIGNFHNSSIAELNCLNLSDRDKKAGLAMAYLHKEDWIQKYIGGVRGNHGVGEYNVQYIGNDPEGEITSQLNELNQLRAKRQALEVPPLTRQRISFLVSGLLNRTEKFIQGR
jgi:hypothetical protein